jgi:hypothetical protein
MKMRTGTWQIRMEDFVNSNERSQPMSRRNMSPPSAGSKNTPSKTPAWKLFLAWLILRPCRWVEGGGARNGYRFYPNYYLFISTRIRVLTRTTECCCPMISTWLRIREVSYSKLGPETGHLDSFLILFGPWSQMSRYNLKLGHSHFLSHSHHSIIWRYTIWAIEFVSLDKS